MTNHETALALDKYMTWRAAKEGVSYELDPDFFQRALYEFVRTFFGVLVDYETGLIEDEPQPGLFEEYRRMRIH
jgi:hypothetical protein